MPGQGAQPTRDSVLPNGAQCLQCPPSVPSRGSYAACRSEASFSDPQLIPCTTSFPHGAPLSPRPASAGAAEGWLSLGAAFQDGIWYFQGCFPPPSLSLGFCLYFWQWLWGCGEGFSCPWVCRGDSFPCGISAAFGNPAQPAAVSRSHRAVCKTAEKPSPC